MVSFSNSERVDMVMLYGVADGNPRLVRELWIVISEITVPLSLKLTIVVVIGPKKYCNLRNKFWNVSKKSPTAALGDLQLKLESYTHTTFKKAKLWSPLIFHVV